MAMEHSEQPAPSWRASTVNGGSPDPAGVLRAVDYNGDGKLDLVVASSFIGGVQVFTGHGDGTFQSLFGVAAGNGQYPDGSPAAFTMAVSVADLNHDGREDLVALSLNEPSPTIEEWVTELDVILAACQ